MSTIRRETRRFRPGDWVTFRYGAKDLIAQVSEARGPLGVDGRRLYRISVPRELAEVDSFEMPEDDLDPAPMPDTTAVTKYLREGGLLEILRSNPGGGKNQPRVWLTYTPRGDVTHTFIAERGLVGGATVPCYALHNDKVFAGKKEEVAAYLGTFGLSPVEAKSVIAGVGTS